jgi:hypothetical protein
MTRAATMRPGIPAALLALSIAACGRPADESASEGGRQAAARFLDELRAGRLAPAWQDTSAEFKSLMGLENLRDYVKTHPVLKAPAEHVETRTVDRDGRKLTESVFRATTRVRGKARSATIRVLLTAEGDGWKVEHLAVE